jgi:homoserine kinase
MALNEDEDESQSEGWQVAVPATSANLGCAFDCAGLALKLYLRAAFFPSQLPGLTLTYQGRTPERVPVDQSNLLLRSMQFAASQLGAPAPSGRVVMENDFPVGAGLGSSAAAVVAGLLLAIRHSGRDVPQEQLLGWAHQIEGHADNAAAALCGGLVFAMPSAGRVTAFKAIFPESLRLILIVPDVMVSTHEARNVLPRYYDRSEVLHSLQRVAALAATCFSGKFDLVPEMFDDRLHQPYRRQLAPGLTRCLQYRHEGLRGVVISGSGSAILAFADRNEDPIAAGLRGIFEEEGVRTETIVTSADNQGAVVSRASAAGAENLVNASAGVHP